MASVRVAVRVRPLNKREKQLSSVINIMGNTASVNKPSNTPPGHELKVFSYDFSYDSTDKESPTFASQEKIYNDLGPDVLKAAFEGVNACVFAYGQTGSGKTYTMMGHQDDKGIIPRLCEGLYIEMDQRKSGSAVSFCTEVSYLEIYNERVHDLLQKRPANTDGGLRVREHPLDGPYVENLSRCLVHNHRDMEDLMALGNAHRTTGPTGMNQASSRSHAIFTIRFTQAWFDEALPRKTSSKIHLVDLAGSERAGAASTSGSRLKEGASINKSLVTLGGVISTLAEVAVGGPSPKKKPIFIPYRDSVLTWLLKDSLGGSSMTTMIATVSPAAVNYSETLSTLRYASRAKNIVNCPTVNEDHGGKLIRELKAEVARLQRLLAEASQIPHRRPSSTVQAELHHNDKKEETGALEGARGVDPNHHLPHLIGVNEDLLGDGIIRYYLKEGRTLVGTDKAPCGRNIALSGPGVLGEHCVLENLAGTVTLVPQEGALCSVNGSVVTGPCQLTRGAIIQLGTVTILRFIQPSHADELRHQHEAETVHQSVEDTHPVVHSSAYVYTFMEHLVKKILPKVPLEGGLLSALWTDGSSSGKESESMPPTPSLDLDGKLNGSENSAITAIPGEYPILHNSFHSDEASRRGGVSTGEGQEEGASCHKSEPGPVSARPQKARSVAEHASYEGAEVWSGDASLQQTSVLGPGDGCGARPQGNANKIQDATADCSGGRPGSGETSLGETSHLQGGGGTSSAPAHASARSWPDKTRPPERTPFKARFCSTATGENGVASPGGSEAAGAKKSRRTSLVSKVSWVVEDADGLFWIFSALQQVRREGLEPVWARWSSHVLPLLRSGSIISIAMASEVVAEAKATILSLFKDGDVVSVVRDRPLVQLIMSLRRNFPPGGVLRIFHNYVNVRLTNPPGLRPARGRNEEEDGPAHLSPDGDFFSQNPADLRRGITEDSLDPGVPGIRNVPGRKALPPRARGVAHQALTAFPDALLSLQTLPLPDLMDALRAVVPASPLGPQKAVAAYWLSVAKCRQAEPLPALLLLAEAGVYALTAASGPPALFSELPLSELREVRIALGGRGLRLLGAAAGSALHVHTHSPQLTQEVCGAVLGAARPGEGRLARHPLLAGDLMAMSLDRGEHVADLQLDAGLRVSSGFQRSVADLTYRLHQNMEADLVLLGDVRLLFYTTVAARRGSAPEALAQLALTNTHLGLLREAPCADTPCRPRVGDVAARRRSDLRCVAVHTGGAGLDLIFKEGGGRRGSVSDSLPHAEVWKLTFSCSSEAACLMNHLSNV